MAHLQFALDKKQFIIKLLLRHATLWYAFYRYSKASAQENYTGGRTMKNTEKNKSNSLRRRAEESLLR